jgi:DNA primase large subunit
MRVSDLLNQIKLHINVFKAVFSFTVFWFRTRHVIICHFFFDYGKGAFESKLLKEMSLPHYIRVILVHFVFSMDISVNKH